MTWTKLSDDFSDDCWELSDAAVRLHMEGLVWLRVKPGRRMVHEGSVYTGGDVFYAPDDDIAKFWLRSGYVTREPEPEPEPESKARKAK
jgi:hypothetical protein